MTEFFRFPHTAHLAWLGSDAPRSDKLLAPSEAKRLLAGELVVEEKVDGANLGLSISDGGLLRAQNRGRYLDVRTTTGQWKPLKRWLALREHALVATLAPDLILFGEWCYAMHSVRYTRLPDWFLAFDVYDRANNAFWSVNRRNELANRLHIAVVPEFRRGRFDLESIKRLLGSSHLTDGPAEGLYVRREVEGRLVKRAKLVRPEFVQAIGDHWSKRRLVENQLARAGS
jgi:ATP-dependent RNA circularization protein (DNA/RNA ligase family)